jgi:prevent-host-death family protein
MSKAKRPVVKAKTQRRHITITKRGKPVARLVPVAEDLPDIFGRMKGTIEILGDIVSPIGEVWDADRDEDVDV